VQGLPTPTKDDEAPIPTDHERNGLHGPSSLSPGNVKALKCIFPFDLKAEEMTIRIQKTKRPRFETSLRASTDEGTIKKKFHATTVTLSPPDAAEQADSDPVKGICPKARTTWTPRFWTP
jgi:hypothetical protein